MDRFILGVERAAGLFLAVIAALTFISASGRYLFAWQIPDWFILACLFQGIAIFWGMACTTWSGKHIVVDLLWEWGGPRARLAIDVFATLVSFAFLAVFAWMLGLKVESTFASNQVSSDVGFVLWPFHALAALGVVAGAVLALLRLFHLYRSA